MISGTLDSHPRLRVTVIIALISLGLCAASGLVSRGQPSSSGPQSADSPPNVLIPDPSIDPPFSPAHSRPARDLRPLVKVHIDSKDDWRTLRSLDAELYLRGDNYAVVRLLPENLCELDAGGLLWKALPDYGTGQLYLLIPDNAPPPLPSLDIASLATTPDGTIVSITADAAAKAVAAGYKALPLARTWPIWDLGYPDSSFIHDVVTPHVGIRDILNEVSRDSLAAYIQHLEDYGTRYVHAPQAFKAGRWLVKRLWGFGYPNTLYQGISPDGKVNLANGNVITTKTGRSVSRFRIIVGGHYDSIVNDGLTSPMDEAPGADDNASGTAATLEIARLLADVDLDATIQFVLFTAEETGLHGSIEMARQLVRDGVPPEDIIVLNMDMIANADKSPWEVLFFYDSLSLPIARLCSRITEAYTDLIPVMAGHSSRSDHYPFQQAGYPAIFVHDGGPHPNYHTVDDKLVHLEIDYATEVVRVVLAAVLHLGRIAEPPDAVAAVETASGDLLVEWNHSTDADVLGYHVEALGDEGGLVQKSFTTENHITLDTSMLQDVTWVRVRTEDVLGESEPSEPTLIAPGKLMVFGVTPNPTNYRSQLDLFIPGSGGQSRTTVRIFDAAGRLVRIIQDGPLPRGSNRLEWQNSYSDGSPVPSGIYFYAVDVIGIGQRYGKIMVVR